MTRWLLALVILFLGVGRADAHPHEWLDFKVMPQFAKDGRITALRETWYFDSFYTELSMPDFDTNKNKKLDADELLALARDNVSNLKDFDYFTSVTAGGQKTAISHADDVTSHLSPDKRIVLEFTVHFKTPAKTPLSYSIYDPSYYIEMKHFKEGAITLSKEGCTSSITRPNPDSVYVALAKSLDKNAVAPENLGVNFAEKAVITCP